MARHLPENSVAGELEHGRQAVRIRRLEIERHARIVSGSLAMNMVVRGHKTDGCGCSSRPDISQIEHPQRFARREVDRHAKALNHCGLLKGGSVYPWEARSERTPSSALPCCSTALARRMFASTSAAVVLRCSVIRNAITAPARSQGRTAFLNSVQIFMHVSRSRAVISPRCAESSLPESFSLLRSSTHFCRQNPGRGRSPVVPAKITPV